MRRKVKNRNIVGPDFKYDSAKVGKFINYAMVRGQKETARGIVYNSFDIIKEKMKVNDMANQKLSLKPLKPTLRGKKRYVQFRLFADKGFDERSVERSIFSTFLK